MFGCVSVTDPIGLLLVSEVFVTPVVVVIPCFGVHRVFCIVLVGLWCVV